MDARAVALTPARGLNGRGPLMLETRLDITDYGPPGSHLTGPWAKTKAFNPGPRVLGDDDSPGGPGASACDRRGNFAVVAQTGVGAGVTIVNPTRGGFGPAIIRQVEYWCELAIPIAAVQLLVKVAEDVDTTGGVLTSGTRIRDVAGSFDCLPMIQKITAYPNFLVTFSGQWNVKVIAVNGDVAARTFQTWVSYDLLS